MCFGLDGYVVFCAGSTLVVCPAPCLNDLTQHEERERERKRDARKKAINQVLFSGNCMLDPY